MKKIAIFFTIVGTFIFFAQSVPAQYAVRTEVYPLQSMTLTTAQILTGRADGKPVTLAGELRMPAGKPGAKCPAMVLVHGSSGIGINIDRWAREFNKIGIASFVIDSFTARGIVSTSNDQGQLDHLAMLYDAYRALDLLASNPRIDPKRIGIIGFSKGGVAGVYAAMDRFHNVYGSKKERFAVYMAFYPPCYPYHDDVKVDGKPIRIYHGAADDYVPMAPCREYVDRLQAAGANAGIIGYPDAFHGFDMEVLPVKLRLPAVQQAVKCRITEGSNGIMINVDTGKALSRTDACAGLGATAGYNKAAHEKSIEDVTRELKAVFKIEKH